MRLLFAGYVNVGRCLHFELGLPVAIVASHTEVSAVCVCVWGGGGGGGVKNNPKQTIATLTRPFEILRYKKRKKTFSM